MEIRKSLDKVVAVAGGCLVFATGGGTAAVGAGMAGSGAALLSAWLEGKAKHGPESKRVLGAIRQKVLAEFGDGRGLNEEDDALLAGADHALSAVLLDCIPEPKRLAAAFGEGEDFTKAAAKMIMAKVAAKDDLFAKSGPRSAPLARRFALTVIEQALETALTNRDYFAKLVPFVLASLKRDSVEILDVTSETRALARQISATQDAILRIVRKDVGFECPSIVSYLGNTDQYRDSWQRLVVQVDCVGRQHQINWLIEFAEDDPPFAWQVLYGGHATGKTRLGYEWLKALEQGDRGWTTGFLTDEGMRSLVQADMLWSEGDVAILIDNAGGHEDRLWDALLKLMERRGGGRVRVLLVAHTELDPPPFPFERQEKLRSGRETRCIPSKEGPPRRVEQPGLLLRPLWAQWEQVEILSRAAHASGADLDGIDVDQLVKQAGGRPAFLALAGAYPKDWRNKLSEYASSLVAMAQKSFRDAPRAGVSVLLLSALAGPVEDEVRAQIAPAADDPAMLRRLFPEADTDVSQTIPRFEPDLLAQEVVFAAMHLLSHTEQAALAHAICTAAPVRFAEQATLLWRREEAAYWILEYHQTGTSSLAHRGSVLETLNAALAAAPAGAKASELLTARNATYLRAITMAVKASPSDRQRTSWQALLTGGFAPLSRTSWLHTIGKALADCALSADDAPSCAALLHKFGSNGDRGLDSIFSRRRIRGRRHRRPDLRGGKLIRMLRSSNRLDRLYAAFEIEAWGAESPVPLIDSCAGFDQACSALERLEGSAFASDRIAAASALWGILSDEGGRPGYSRIRDTKLARVEEAIGREEPDETALYLKLGLIGVAFRQPFSMHWIENWLPPSVNSVQPARTARRRPSERTMQTLLLLRSSQREGVSENAAIALFHSGFWDERMARELPGLYRDTAIISVMRAVISLLKQGTAEAFAALIRLFEVQPPFVQARIIAACAQFGAIQVLERIDGLLLDLELGVDLHELIVEARQAKIDGYWPGPVAEAFRARLRDLAIAEKGHLIHKLKAKDTTGRWAYYFVLVEPDREAAFLRSIEGDGTVDLEDYGRVVASCYGEEPTAEVREFLGTRYGFTV